MSVLQSREKSLVVEYTEGICVYTSDKKKYLDGISGIFNLPFGYSCKPIKESIKHQLDKFAFHPKEQFYHAKIISLSDRLLKLCKMDNGATLFLTSGSEAIEAGIATALEFHRHKGNPSKKKVISRRHSYHGATLGAHSISGRNGFSEVRHSGYDVVSVTPPFDVWHQGIFEAAGSLELLEADIISADPETIAVFLFEPVNHLKGMRSCSNEYFQKVRELCDKYDILYMVDEIVTGAYRTGPFLNIHYAGIQPDIVALGKGISGGYTPAAAMVISERVAMLFPSKDSWKKHPYSHTYSANPISLVAIEAALYELDKLKTKNVIAELSQWLTNFVKNLTEHPLVKRAESRGALMGITLERTLGDNIGKAVEKRCFDKGLILRGEEDWVCLAPCYITSKDEWNEIVTILLDVLFDIENENNA